MALNASTFKSMLIGEMASNGMTGQYVPQLSDSIAQGVTTYILGVPVCIQTSDSGLTGGGTGSSKVVGINQGILFPLMVGQFSSESLLGPYGINNLPKAISSAFSNWFNSFNQTQTTHSGVGTGVGVGRVINLDSSAMSNAIIGFMAQNGIIGEYHENIARAVGQSIVPHVLMVGTVTTPINGGGAIPPASGTGTGKII